MRKVPYQTDQNNPEVKKYVEAMKKGMGKDKCMGEHEIKAEMFMYEHQWAGDDKQRFCETCKEAVELGSPCKASKYYPRWQELNNQLTPSGNNRV